MTSLSRSQWGKGPWEYETDRYEFVFKSTKTGEQFPCVIERDEQTGTLVGNIRVDSSPSIPYWLTQEEINKLKVHGGIKYLGPARKPNDVNLACWLKFSTDNLGDYKPAHPVHIGHEEYRIFSFVENQLDDLVDQIVQIKLKHFVKGIDPCRETPGQSCESLSLRQDRMDIDFKRLDQRIEAIEKTLSGFRSAICENDME